MKRMGFISRIGEWRE